MAKQITFLLGRAKTGKSGYIADKIAQHEKNREPALLIVPQRFSFETERRLANHLSGGVFYTKICSLSSLMDKVFEEMGERRTFLSAVGRLMVVRRAIEYTKLGVFEGVKQRIGFAKECDRVILGFMNYGVKPAELAEIVESYEESSLPASKLRAACALYSSVSDFMEDRYINAADAAETFVALMKDSQLCNSHIYIDGLDEPSALTYHMIEGLFDAAKSVTVTIRCDIDGGERSGSLFASEVKAFNRLKTIARDKGLSCEIIKCPEKGAYLHPELRHIERELFSFPHKVYKGECTGVELFCATDIKEEVRALVSCVKEAALKGVRYREMAVMATDSSVYAVMLRSELEKAGIPVFSDYGRELSSMSAPLLVLSALCAVNSGFALSDCVSVMKTGLSGLETDEIEKLENYMLGCLINGSEMKESFTRGKVTQELEAARQKLMTPLLALRSALSGGDISQKIGAVFDYLQSLNVREQLEIQTEQLKGSGKTELMSECAQVWNSVIEVAEQLSSVMGDVKLSNAAFARILEEGFRARVVSTVPACVDSLMIGDFSHTIPAGIKNLYVVGAVEGKLPKFTKDGGIIDDDDLKELESHGLTLWANSDGKYDGEVLGIYSAFTAPTELLYISYPLVNNSSECMPCALVMKIREILPSVISGTNIDKERRHALADADRFAALMRELCDGKGIAGSEREMYSWFLNTQKEQVEQLHDAVNYMASPENLEADFALRFYERGLASSISRMETFNSCPFRHFLTYGMKAKERKTFTEKPMDIGSFCHEVLDAFVRTITENNIKYKAMTRAQSDKLIDSLLPEILRSFNPGMFDSSARSRARTEYYVRNVKNTAFAVIEHMRRGSFEFTCSEATFGMNESDTFPPLEIEAACGNERRTFMISGKIDRLDSCKVGEDTVFRVVDYKLNGKEFDIAELYEGIELQLPLYLSAVQATMEHSFGAGMYYMPINAKEVNEKDALKGKLQERFRLVGLSASELSVLELTDNALGGDSEYSSPVVNAGLEKSGNLKSSKSLVTNEQLQRVKAYALKKAAATANAIVNGHIEVAPYERNSKSSCDYCPFKSVCTFDKRLAGCTLRKLNTMSLEELFDDTI